ncbi:MAG: hypothetical protein CL927_11820 [Deltaproteobacteria bacterium]|nr:hypothetical protein [Deltaproteobacteria bacterium]HCH62599.1 hypothetical protein [Deltaproteobacteria bacterium]
MKRIEDGLLLAAAAGALDPGRAQDLADRLAVRPTDAARLQRLQAALEPSKSSSHGWRLPPSGRWGSVVQRPLQAAPVLHMDGSHGLRPGARVRLSLPSTDGIEDPGLLVLWRGTGSWQCMIPQPGSAPIAVERIPAGTDGIRVIEVVMQPDAARQHWAVVMVPGALDVDWTDVEAVPTAVLEAVAQRRATLDVVAFAVTQG